MNESDLINATRNLCNEMARDSGALLSDGANIVEFLNDALEIVTLDLIDSMPKQFLATETITLVANQANYDLTAEWWMIYKIERNITNQPPTAIEVINVLDKSDYMTIGETDAEPEKVYLQGDTFYFVPTPSAAHTDYATVYYVAVEATTIPNAGPTYVPRVFHRCIAYKAAELVAVMLEASPAPFVRLYNERMAKGMRVWNARIQQDPKFINSSVYLRRSRDARDTAFYDVDWR